MVEHSAEFIILIDGQGRLVEANPATVRLIGQRIGQFVPSILEEVVHADDLEGVSATLVEVLSEPGLHRDAIFRVADGERWVTLQAIANNQIANPAVLGVVVNALDISTTVEYMEKAKGLMHSMISALIRATDLRDPYTAGHEMQVADLSCRIARHLGLNESECELIELGASIHDIGKLAIPAEILNRPGRLSPLEFEMVKTHCRVGHSIIADVDLPAQIADIVLHHHERLDGSGYPDNLAGDAISLPAKIVAVADVLDAMSSHRPYRPALGIDAARAEIQRGRGTQYDPTVVDAALACTAPMPTSLPSQREQSNQTMPM